MHAGGFVNFLYDDNQGSIPLPPAGTQIKSEKEVALDFEDYLNAADEENAEDIDVDSELGDIGDD